jgi:hypothetical protein
VITSPESGLEVPPQTTSITVQGTAFDMVSLSRVQFRVNAGAWSVASGSVNWSASIPLAKGDNLIEIRSVDGSGLFSEIQVCRVRRLVSSDSTLSWLSIDSGLLAPNFATDVKSYVANVPADTDSVTLYTNPTDFTATVEINGMVFPPGGGGVPIELAAGPNVINIVVTAMDESRSIYTIIVTRIFEYNAWINGFFAGIENSSIIGPAADPDHDGFPNAIELVVGGKPDGTSSDSTKVPIGARVRLDLDGAGPAVTGEYFHFSHRRTQASVDAGVSTTCEYTHTLSGEWTDATNAPGVVKTVTHGGTGPEAYGTIDYFIPIQGNDPIGFARLKAVVP